MRDDRRGRWLVIESGGGDSVQEAATTTKRGWVDLGLFNKEKAEGGRGGIGGCSGVLRCWWRRRVAMAVEAWECGQISTISGTTACNRGSGAMAVQGWLGWRRRSRGRSAAWSCCSARAVEDQQRAPVAA